MTSNKFDAILSILGGLYSSINTIAGRRISVRFRHFFLSSYRVNFKNCNLCARANIKGKIEENLPSGNWSSHCKFGSSTGFRFMGYGRQKMAQFLTAIGHHFECAIQTELVVELKLALIERKQSRRFRHNFIIRQKDMKGSA